MRAASPAGPSATSAEDGVTETQGTVESVRFTAAGPMLTVGGVEVPIANVVTVAA